MEYASLDKVRQSWRQVSHFDNGLNEAKIISHDDEQQRVDCGVNNESMLEYCYYLGMEIDEIQSKCNSTLYSNDHKKRPAKQRRSMGRGRLLEDDHFNYLHVRERKLKQDMDEAGICSFSNRDVASAFNELFEKKEPEESSYEWNDSKQSTSSRESSSEEFEGSLTNSTDLDQLDKIAFSKNQSPSDFNNNRDRSEEKRGLAPRGDHPDVALYVPPFRRNVLEEAAKPFERKEERKGFTELLREADEWKKSELKPVVHRRTSASELLADPVWNKEPEEKTASLHLGAKPKCRNAVLSQFLPKEPASKRNVIPAGLEDDEDVSPFINDSSSNKEPFEWIPAEKVPTARRMMETFNPPEEKPRNLVLGDFIVTPKPTKKKPLNKK